MGKVIDVNGEITTTALLLPVAKTANFDGTGVDISGYDGILKCTVAMGAIAGTDTPKLVGKIMHSDNDSDYTDVTGAVFPDITAASKTHSIGVDTRVCKKYIRLTGTITGTNPSFTIASVFSGQKQYL